MLDGGEDGFAVAADAGTEGDEGIEAASGGPAQPPVQGLDGFVAGQLEDQSQTFLEQVGAVEAGVGLGDPGQLVGLSFGEVLGVLPQCLAGPFQGSGVAGGQAAGLAVGAAGAVAATGGAAGAVPGLPTDHVEGVGRPADHVERVGAAHRVRASLGDHVADPLRAVGADLGDQRAALRAEGVEERVQGGLVPAWRGPHQPAGVVVDHDRQIPVPALVGDLVDPDPAQPGEPVGTASTSAQTRVMIAPTVRHATRISSVTAVFEHCVANHATCSSNTRV